MQLLIACDEPELNKRLGLTMQVALINDSSELATRMVKAQLEKTLLGTLCQSMSLVMHPGSAFVDIVLDLPLIEQLQLRIDPISVRRAIVAQRKLKLAFDQVRCGTTTDCRFNNKRCLCLCSSTHNLSCMRRCSVAGSKATMHHVRASWRHMTERMQ